MQSTECIDQQEDLPPAVMNSLFAKIGASGTELDGTIFSQPEFILAKRVDEQNAYRVVVQCSYTAGPTIGIMSLVCLVHDDECPEFGPGSGILRVSDLCEDHDLTKFHGATIQAPVADLEAAQTAGASNNGAAGKSTQTCED